jgi:hypothetical protein
MKNSIPTPIRASAVSSPIDTPTERSPDYSSELITFGVIALTVFWSMFVLASAMAGTLKCAQIRRKKFYELIIFRYLVPRVSEQLELSKTSMVAGNQ